VCPVVNTDTTPTHMITFNHFLKLLSVSVSCLVFVSVFHMVLLVRKF